LSKQANKANINGSGPANSERDRSAAAEVARPLTPAIPAGGMSHLIRANWKLIALVTLAVTGLAWIIAAMQADRYRASALAAVVPLVDTLQANEVLRGVEVLERRMVVATVAALASTPSTRTGAAAGEAYDIEAVVLPNTSLFRVDVLGEAGAPAAEIANRIPELLNRQTRAMYKYYGVAMVSPAVAPSSAALPRTGRALAAGLLFGLFLGLLAAYANQWRTARRGIAT
jgi:capsular polysaccharide biosynthesis protein